MQFLNSYKALPDNPRDELPSNGEMIISNTSVDKASNEFWSAAYLKAPRDAFSTLLWTSYSSYLLFHLRFPYFNPAPVAQGGTNNFPSTDEKF